MTVPWFGNPRQTFVCDVHSGLFLPYTASMQQILLEIPDELSAFLAGSATTSRARLWKLLRQRPIAEKSCRPANCAAYWGTRLECRYTPSSKSMAFIWDTALPIWNTTGKLATPFLIDEADARREAARRHLPFMGTLGVLRIAARLDLIDLPSDLGRLQQTTFYVDPN